MLKADDDDGELNCIYMATCPHLPVHTHTPPANQDYDVHTHSYADDIMRHDQRATCV